VGGGIQFGLKMRDLRIAHRQLGPQHTSKPCLSLRLELSLPVCVIGSDDFSVKLMQVVSGKLAA